MYMQFNGKPPKFKLPEKKEPIQGKKCEWECRDEEGGLWCDPECDCECHQPPTQESWEERFDKEFDYWDEAYPLDYEGVGKLKRFIAQELERAKPPQKILDWIVEAKDLARKERTAEAISLIEGMEKERESGVIEEERVWSYNAALKDIVAKLKDLDGEELKGGNKEINKMRNKVKLAPKGTSLADFQKVRTDAISEMFDNEDKHGIYPTGKFFATLDRWVEKALKSPKRNH